MQKMKRVLILLAAMIVCCSAAFCVSADTYVDVNEILFDDKGEGVSEVLYAYGSKCALVNLISNRHTTSIFNIDERYVYGYTSIVTLGINNIGPYSFKENFVRAAYASSMDGIPSTPYERRIYKYTNTNNSCSWKQMGVSKGVMYCFGRMTYANGSLQQHGARGRYYCYIL